MQFVLGFAPAVCLNVSFFGVREIGNTLKDDVSNMLAGFHVVDIEGQCIIYGSLTVELFQRPLVAAFAYRTTPKAGELVNSYFRERE